ncbi:MAG: hypothetical protein CMJ46_11935 [Planctomyces sp.]|nr:hypothetical protein [Planctomyces sp.]
MTELTDNRWVAGDEEFAVRIDVKDVPGFFSKEVVVEPGTRALFLENGILLGEVPPGKHQLQTISDTFAFWTKKKTTLILAKEKEVAIDLSFSELRSKEMLTINASMRLTVGIGDIALFFSHILTSQQTLTLPELKKMIMPIVQQAIHEAVNRLSLIELSQPRVRTDLELCIRQALANQLVLRGLKFGSVQTLSMSHPEYDKQRERVGQIWLQRNALESDKEEAELNAARLLAAIEKRESIDELEILAENVAADREQAEVAAKVRRMSIRKELKDAVQADEFDKVSSEEEMRRFLLERDKQRLLDEDEIDALAKTLKERSDDQKAKREHLLRQIDVQQTFELESIRIDLNYAQRIKTLQHEQSLNSLLEGDAQKKWAAELEREAATAAHAREEQLKELSHSQKTAREALAAGQENELTQLLHEQRTSLIRNETELAKSNHEGRVEIIKWETTQTIELQRLELEKRRDEFEFEKNKRAWENQKNRLSDIQDLNKNFLRDQQELKERESRLNAELAADRDLREKKHELERLHIQKEMSTESLVATSEIANAELLAGLKKHEATEQAITRAAEAQAASSASTHGEVKELYERLSQANASKADAAVAALQQALADKQRDLEIYSSTIEGVTRHLSSQSTPNPTTSPSAGSTLPNSSDASPTTNESRKVVVCAGCRTENPITNRFCTNCGKGL